METMYGMVSRNQDLLVFQWNFFLFLVFFLVWVFAIVFIYLFWKYFKNRKVLLQKEQEIVVEKEKRLSVKNKNLLQEEA